MDLELPYKPTHGYDGLYGLEILSADVDSVRGVVSVRDELKQPAGLIHGGVYASIAESLASLGTAVQVMSDGKVAMGLGNHTSFMRPITEGTIHGEAVVLHRGRTTWVWEVRITDDEGRLCAVTRMTVAVREQPSR
ncbi:MAG: PaaI family thioesterase [Actinomycetota bacterium]|nr:PaaI family thioesterase [Actinomycetota bacterium]